MVAGPFKILQRVGDLASKLPLPNYFRIYPVIIVVHLKECPDHLEEQPIIDVVGAGKRIVEKIVGGYTNHGGRLGEKPICGKKKQGKGEEMIMLA